MSSVPTTIRSLLCSWERSFPGRHTTFNVTFIAIRNHFQQQLMPNSFHIIFAFITPLMLNLIALRVSPTDSIRALCIAVDGLAILCTGAEERETKIK
uniref:Uncharacterized protein n=1 Tax=Fagus sylvatica TaxID=28930 RepID=A0A2N9HVL6_FAGSY